MVNARDLKALTRLIEKYSAAVISRLIEQIGRKPSKKPGAKRYNAGTALAVWKAVEFRRRRSPQKMTQDQAIKRVLKDFERSTVPPYPTFGALRTLYFQAKRSLKADAYLREHYEALLSDNLKTAPSNSIMLPVLFKEFDGELRSGMIIDRRV
jgi:hypothetical protein